MLLSLSHFVLLVFASQILCVHLNDPIYERQWHLLSFSSFFGVNVEVGADSYVK
jgi:hypothetical protein